MMQVNLYPAQDPVPVTAAAAGLAVVGGQEDKTGGHQQQQLSLEPAGQHSTADILSLNRKPLVSNNNEAIFSKEIFTIAQGTEKHEPSNTGRRLIHSQHFSTLLAAAKDFCIRKDFVDVYLQCEDGTLAAHAFILSIASPFLKRLLETELLNRDPAATRCQDPPVLVLPDVRMNLVQSLLEFLYTGEVVTVENQFYSLMKLIYDLEINASIDADKTSAQPTKFELVPVLKTDSYNNAGNECESCRRPRKRSRVDTFDSTFSALFDPTGSQGMLINRGMTTSVGGGSTVPLGGSAASTTNWRSTPGGLAVNSLTASGVEVKQEPEEKPSVDEGDMHHHHHQHHQLQGAHNNHHLVKTSINTLGSTVNTLSSNSINNNQLSHFVAVNSGYQVKLELTGGSGGPHQNTNPHLTAAQPTNHDNNKESSNSDDPLAAIMNQTIFEGEGLNMYIQVPGSSTATYLSTTPPAAVTTSSGSATSVVTKMLPQEAKQQQRTSPQKKNDPSSTPVVTPKSSQTATVAVSSVEEMHCSPEGEGGEVGDSANSFNCDLCSRVMKGKMMLQAHKFQEHHVNPELENASIPQNKFPCRVCCKLFTRNSDVKAHILRVHCGDRRYPCTLCGKRFKESTHLRKHLYTHTGERPHFCSHCNKGFQTSSDLKRHKKTRVHQERVDQANANAANKPVTTTTVTTTPSPQVEKTPSMDSNIDFDGWNEPDDDLTGGGGGQVVTAGPGSRNSPFNSINPIDASSQQRTSPSNTSVVSPPLQSGVTASNMPIFTTTATPTTQYIQMPTSRGASNTNLLVQHHSVPGSAAAVGHVQQLQFVSDPQQGLGGGGAGKQVSWSPNGGNLVLHQGGATDGSGQDIGGLSASPLADVLSSLPSQPMGVQNLTLPSTTLDLSDIKWGILDPTTVVSNIKRSGSMEESHVQATERLHIRDDMH